MDVALHLRRQMNEEARGVAWHCNPRRLTVQIRPVVCFVYPRRCGKGRQVGGLYDDLPVQRLQSPDRQQGALEVNSRQPAFRLARWRAALWRRP